jgi:hypothetical protein
MSRSPYLYPPGYRVARIYPQALGSLFVDSYDSQGYSGSIRTRIHTDRIENIVSNSSIFVYSFVATIAYFGVRGNVFTGRCLEMDDFSC